MVINDRVQQTGNNRYALSENALAFADRSAFDGGNRTFCFCMLENTTAALGQGIE